MSKYVRIIPRLDIKGPNLVKGVHLEGLRVLGKPEDFARYYYENGADELVYMDVVASLYGRNNLLDIVNETSKEIFIPLTVGGGLRTLDDIRATLRAGADKVSINTATINRPELIKEASKRFGSSTIVISIEVIKHPDGTYEAYTDNGREKTGIDAFEWAVRAAELGAGELMVTSIDKEGTGNGFDLELIKKIAESVSIPVIAGGGAGSLEHIKDVIIEGNADAVSIASILHYNFIKQYTIDNTDFFSEGNIEYLKKNRHGFSRINDTTLVELKKYLTSSGINCRYNKNIDFSMNILDKKILSTKPTNKKVAIVDYGMGNLFSVKHACECVGLNAKVTSSKEEILSADLVILPGVGAFGDAMEALRNLDLVNTLKVVHESSKPIVGICLGMQLLMSEGHEFGRHKGLGIIKGQVVPFDNPIDDSQKSLKVPQVGWNHIYSTKNNHTADVWKNSILEGINNNEFMYFVHSFYVKPENSEVILSKSNYGGIEFCSTLQYENISACQFHPERSGQQGLKIYTNFISLLKKSI